MRLREVCWALVFRGAACDPKPGLFWFEIVAIDGFYLCCITSFLWVHSLILPLKMSSDCLIIDKGVLLEHPLVRMSRGFPLSAGAHVHGLERPCTLQSALLLGLPAPPVGCGPMDAMGTSFTVVWDLSKFRVSIGGGDPQASEEHPRNWI